MIESQLSLGSIQIDIDSIIKRLRSSKSGSSNFFFNQQQIEGLCTLTKQILIKQPMLLQLKSPVNICGDTHGQYSDLLKIFDLFGNPGPKSYLFLGDYVDRGKKSLECICLLMAYKIKYPSQIFLLRGNHESSQINKIYGFFDQCKRKSTIKVWKKITNTFNYLPVAAVIQDRIFCSHGGLSPLLQNISNINNIQRPLEVKDNQIIVDLLWSDPTQSQLGWAINMQRGISYLYGQNVIEFFLKKYDFDLICRSHQVVEEGYQFMFEKKLLTIFSAPNYCSQFKNLAAVLTIDRNLNCSLNHFQGQPLLRQQKQRSLTPMFQNMQRRKSIQQKSGFSPRKTRITKRSSQESTTTTTIKRILTAQCKQNKQNRNHERSKNKKDSIRSQK